MSRVGKKPVAVPSGVTANVDGQIVKMKGAKGEMSFTVPDEVSVAFADGAVTVTPRDQSKVARSKWGLSRAMLQSIADGCLEGFREEASRSPGLVIVPRFRGAR